jgi:glycerate kinase
LINFSTFWYKSSKLPSLIITTSAASLHTTSGPQSCARVFAPQKGAGKKEIERIDHALDHLSRVAEKQTGINVRKLKGGGAAGGTPAGLYPWLNVSIRSGAAEIMKISGFSEHASRAGVIFTGEGKLDQQSLGGKLPVIIARKAKETGSKVIFIGGRIPENTLAFDSLFEGIFSITPGPCSLEESMENSYDWVKNTSYRIAKLLSLT